MGSVLLALLVLLQTGEKAELEFTLDRPETLTHYEFRLHADGSGTYRATYPASPPASPGETVEVPLHVRAETAAAMFAEAGSTGGFRGGCQAKVKNVAQTGAKTLVFRDAEGASSTCTWNYTEKHAVQALQDEFTATAVTLDAGRRLLQEQRYDRLALDREMMTLVEGVRDRRARGVENIREILRSLAEDRSLLERVRMRARGLLEATEPAS